MAGRLWKEAATLIIIGRSACTKGQAKVAHESDYNLLFLKRSQKSSFMPSAFVFPGGVTEKSDFSLEWLDVFKKCGFTADDLMQKFRNSSPLPGFYANKPPDSLLPEVGFRITAIRETFEECGLLLASEMPLDKENKIDFKKWSQIVHEDASQFLSFFHEYGGCPAIWDLHEWSAWLTPAVFSKRFDTIFYVTFMDEISHVTADRKEITELQVSSPSEILEQGLCGTLWLPPPQTYEISRFLHFQLYDKLKAFSESRGKKGIESWCPVRIMATDGVLSVLPGDDLYPVNSDQEEQTPLMMDLTMEELRKKAKCLHRMEFKSLGDMKLLATIKPKFGHVLPVNFIELQENSKL